MPAALPKAAARDPDAIASGAPADVRLPVESALRSPDHPRRSSSTAVAPTGKQEESCGLRQNSEIGSRPKREGDTVRVRRLALIVTASATVLAIVSGLGACTSSGGSTGLPTQSPTATGSPSAAPASSFGLATNKQYGFSVRYPLGWVSAARTAAPGNASGAPLLSVSWADTKGKVVDGGFVDTLQVAVYGMSKPVKAADLVRYSGDFKAIVDGLIKNLPKLTVTDRFRPITVNGTKGFQITYAYDIGGTPTGAMSYLLPKGSYAYWITGQSSADTWSASWSKLAPAMASFTITSVTSK
jgi:hypothetical protein